MSNSRVYRNPRPRLTIENGGGGQLGNCYYSHVYRITSLNPLSGEDLSALRKAGFIGYGQTHTIKQLLENGTAEIPATLDWKTSPAIKPYAVDMVQCSEVDNMGRVVSCPSTNPYSGEKDKPIEASYFVYECVDYVDSSD